MTCQDDQIFEGLVHDYRQTCLACPTQYEGTLTAGGQFYFRYRHGCASLGIGATEHQAIGDVHTALILHGDHLDGCMDEAEFRAMFVRLHRQREEHLAELAQTREGMGL